jgi:hypothetical protein
MIGVTYWKYGLHGSFARIIAGSIRADPEARRRA